MKIIKKYTFAFCFCLLSACSYLYEPSGSELRNAVAQYLDMEIRQKLSDNMLGAMLSATGSVNVEVHKVEKIKCDDVSKNSAVCEVYIEYTIGSKDTAFAALAGFGTKQSSTDQIRFVKISSGWVVAAK